MEVPGVNGSQVFAKRKEIRDANIARLAVFIGPKLARKLEKECYNGAYLKCVRAGARPSIFAPPYSVYYAELLNKCFSELPIIREDYISGKIGPEDIFQNNIHNICPAIDPELFAIAEARRSAIVECKVSHIYTCKKCGGNSTICTEHQTRALDEGATYSIRCVDCGHSWRR